MMGGKLQNGYTTDGCIGGHCSVRGTRRLAAVTWTGEMHKWTMVTQVARAKQ